MKIKVDKEEYERLLKRVEELERYRAEEWERFGELVNNLQKRMEDYEPAEPLIKDEKVRKAVRAWAEAIGINNCKYDEFWSSFRFNNCTICFKGKYYFGDLADKENYAIAELCGEEEECES